MQKFAQTYKVPGNEVGGRKQILLAVLDAIVVFGVIGFALWGIPIIFGTYFK